MFRWFNWTRRWSKRGSEDMAGEGRFAQEWAEPVELELAPLPCWEGLKEEQRQCAVRGLVEQEEAEARTRGMPTVLAFQFQDTQLARILQHLIPDTLSRASGSGFTDEPHKETGELISPQMAFVSPVAHGEGLNVVSLVQHQRNRAGRRHSAGRTGRARPGTTLVDSILGEA
ncbi:hypothetical protein BON30_15280 [Cystobacter ferrugineus]|uniref:Uncharacterized protein n=1 Tax=Cystobacter ferrugineus TaxID=83449 RepID=A0A1L9BDR4_9BACT|nr:hypothetical protein BON30_15280 [Cystobacter ferrugineus]